jgi:hypothetical protein
MTWLISGRHRLQPALRPILSDLWMILRDGASLQRLDTQRARTAKDSHLGACSNPKIKRIRLTEVYRPL